MAEPVPSSTNHWFDRSRYFLPPSETSFSASADEGSMVPASTHLSSCSCNASPCRSPWSLPVWNDLYGTTKSVGTSFLLPSMTAVKNGWSVTCAMASARLEPSFRSSRTNAKRLCASATPARAESSAACSEVRATSTCFTTCFTYPKRQFFVARMALAAARASSPPAASVASANRARFRTVVERSPVSAFVTGKATPLMGRGLRPAIARFLLAPTRCSHMKKIMNGPACVYTNSITRVTV
mmetsp:Transcript_110432/g.268451  ORF Transcript_110432/g.268451 Transcript_110432/m.268451 type:complete len:240 (-) Transcript_110432:56-775(-)